MQLRKLDIKKDKVLADPLPTVLDAPKAGLKSSRSIQLDAVIKMAAELGVPAFLPDLPSDDARDTDKLDFDNKIQQEIRRLKLEAARIQDEKRAQEEREKAAQFARAAQARQEAEEATRTAAQKAEEKAYETKTRRGSGTFRSARLNV